MPRIFLMRILTLIVALAVGASMLQAKGQREVIAKFQHGNLELDVATYLDPDVAAPDNKVGLIGMSAASQRNSFAFRTADWTQPGDSCRTRTRGLILRIKRTRQIRPL